MEFWNDMKSLNVLFPTFVTRVTDVIPDIIEYIQNILGKGYAYESNGSIYFNTQSFSIPDFHKLSHGENDIDKKFISDKMNQKDFALWKNVDDKEIIAYDSPWGKGRPGWHIECSVMIHKMFNSKLNIHGGGVDLKFPHHYNELLQTAAFTQNINWVDKFYHVGHLNINGEKMSKSKNNFITIKDCLKNRTISQIRLMFMLIDWDRYYRNSRTCTK